MTNYQLDILRANIIGGMISYLSEINITYLKRFCQENLISTNPTEEEIMLIAENPNLFNGCCESFSKILNNL